MAGVAGIGTIFIGVGSGAEAIRLLGAMLPSVRFLCSAVMTASASILALMLTILTFTHQLEGKLDNSYYNRIQQIARFDTIVFTAVSFFLLLVSVPILEESQTFSEGIYQAFYYVTLLYTAVLGGGLIVRGYALQRPHRPHSNLGS